MERTAKTKIQFAKAWISSIKSLWGMYPNDYDDFKAHIDGLIRMVIDKAENLKFPDGEGWAEYRDMTIEDTA